MIAFLRNRRRRRLREAAFPEKWCDILRARMPYYRRLPGDLQRALEGHINVFLAEKNFEGAGGLAMTDEIRVTIAAQACVLLLGQDEPDYYPTLKSIIVYPAAYVARYRSRFAGGLHVESAGARLGESWTRGSVVLSWRDVVAGAEDDHDGKNVVFHEFAHQLDAQFGGEAQGAPILKDTNQYGCWSRVLGEEFTRLRHELMMNQPHLIDAYGATNPAEFFAVVTEHFFEQPEDLRERHPELYGQLKGYYRQDPAAYSPAGFEEGR